MYLNFNTMRLIMLLLILATPFISTRSQEVDREVYEIHFDEENGFYFERHLLNRETVYSLGKVYNSTLEMIQKMNSNLDLDNLNLQQVIRFPLAIEELQSSHNGGPLFIYKVNPEETLYTISKKHFGKDVEEIKELNGLHSNDLAIGQMLEIGFLGSAEVHQPVAVQVPSEAKNQTLTDQEEDVVQGSKLDEPAIEQSILDLIDLIKDTIVVEYKPTELAQPEIAETEEPEKTEEMGLAFTEDLDLYGDELFVLHSKAKVNSTIELTYPMLHTSAKATVISELPGHLYADNISVVISPSVAAALGAKDQLFRVEMRYVE